MALQPTQKVTVKPSPPGGGFTSSSGPKDPFAAPLYTGPKKVTVKVPKNQAPYKPGMAPAQKAAKAKIKSQGEPTAPVLSQPTAPAAKEQVAKEKLAALTNDRQAAARAQIAQEATGAHATALIKPTTFHEAVSSRQAAEDYARTALTQKYGKVFTDAPGWAQSQMVDRAIKAGPVGDQNAQLSSGDVAEAQQAGVQPTVAGQVLDSTATSLVPGSIRQVGANLNEGAPATQGVTAGGVVKDVAENAAMWGGGEILAPVKAARVLAKGVQNGEDVTDAYRTARASLKAERTAKIEDPILQRNLEGSASRTQYTQTLKDAGMTPKQQQATLALHDQVALTYSKTHDVTPEAAWDRIYSHSQYSDASVTKADLDAGGHAFAQEGKQPEISNLAATPMDAKPIPDPEQFVKTQAAKLVRAHRAALPEGFNTPKKLEGLLTELRQRALDASDYSKWYEQSSQAILAHVGGNTQEADKIAALIAVYSPRAEVYSPKTEWNNLDRALNAYNEFHDEGQISPKWSISSHKEGEADWQTFRAQQIMQGQFDWDGLKTNRFYRNFLQHIDPAKYTAQFGDEKFGTMDTWMRRAFRYPKKYATTGDTNLFGEAVTTGKAQEQITPRMYAFMEQANKVIADSLGWSPEEAQAAIWTSIKSETEGTPLEQAGFDFSHAFEHREARIAAPLKPEQLAMESTTSDKPVASDVESAVEAAREPDGGATLTANFKPDQTQKGWATAYGAWEKKLKAPITKEDLLAYRNEHLDVLKSDPSLRLGLWHNPDDGMVYLDISKVFPTHEQALQFGKDQGQLAAADLGAINRGEFDNAFADTGLSPEEADQIKSGHKEQARLEKQSGRFDAFVQRAYKMWNGDLPKNGKLSPAQARKTEDALAQWAHDNPGPEANAYLNLQHEATMARNAPDPETLFKSDPLVQKIADAHGIEVKPKVLAQEGDTFPEHWADQSHGKGLDQVYSDAKDWLADNSWSNMEPEDIHDLPNEAVTKAIDKYYDGGMDEFIKSGDYFGEIPTAPRKGFDPNDPHTVEEGKLLGRAASLLHNFAPTAEGEHNANWFKAVASSALDHLRNGDNDKALELLTGAVNNGEHGLYEAHQAVADLIAHNEVGKAGERPEWLPQGEGFGTTAQQDINESHLNAERRTQADRRSVIRDAHAERRGAPAVKGAVLRQPTGEHALTLFKGADVSTAVHELGHAVETMITPEARKVFTDAGLGDEESFARSFEHYVFTGDAPTAGLKSPMRDLAVEMSKVYKSGADIPGAKLNAATKTAFDSFFLRESLNDPTFAKGAGAAWFAQEDAKPSPDITDEAQSLADKHGIDVTKVVGSGANGRVTIPDVEKYVFEQMKPEDQLRSIMQGLKVTRGKQEAGYNVERGRRFQAAEQHFGNENMSPEDRLIAAKTEMQGELPKIVVNGNARAMNQDTLDQLLTTVFRHPTLMTGQKTKVADALLDLVKSGRTPTRGELSLMQHVWGKDTVASLQEMASKWHQGWQLALSALNIPRSIMSSMDVSFGLRQALVAAFYDPSTWWKAYKAQFQYLSKYTGGGEEAYQALMEGVHAKPNYPIYQEMGLAITDLEHEIGMREEQYQSNLAEKLTIKGHGPGNMVRGSGRAYTGMAVTLRTELADKLLAEAAARGQDIHNEEFLHELGHFINGITGRGDLPSKVLQESAPLLNTLFFSPRLLASRIQMLNPKNYLAGDKFVRRQYLRAGLRTFGALATILGAVKLFVPGAEVGTDWRSSDFGKIKVGDTRIDLGGGFNQLFHLMGMIYTGQKISSTTGQLSSLTSNKFGQATRMDAFVNFLSGKLAPVPSMVNDWAKNKDPNHLGQPFNWKDEAASHFQPLIAQDAWQLYNDPSAGLNGIEAAAAGYGIEAQGVGIQTYKPTVVGAKQQKKLETQAKEAGLPAPSHEVLIDVANKAQLDAISAQHPGDPVGRMTDALKFYEKQTGDTSYAAVGKRIADAKDEKDAELLVKNIRTWMIGTGISQYEHAIRVAGVK